MQNQLHRLLIDFRHSRKGSMLIPSESAFSLPIPFWRNKHAFVTVLVYGTNRSQDGKGLTLLAPEFAVTLAYPTGRLARLEDVSCLQVLGEKTPPSGKPIGIFPHPSIASLNTSEYTARRLQFLEFTESLLQTRDVPPDYQRLFSLMMEPSLAPYYWYYSPKFIRDFMTPKDFAK